MKPPKGVKVIAVKVQNKNLSVCDFDTLCTILSKRRPWCHDYRTVKNFDPKTQTRYWESQTYYTNEQLFIDATLSAVTDCANAWLKTRKLPANAIDIKLVTYDI